MKISSRLASATGVVVAALILSTAPAVAVVCDTDTTVADFGSGGSCYVAQTGDGEVILVPTEGSEFYGAALPGDWASFLWSGGGSATVGSGLLTVDAARANPEPIGLGDYAAGRVVEAVATFQGQPFQHVGFGAGNHLPPNEVFNFFPIAIFSTGSAGTQVQARYGNSFPLTDVNVGSFCPNTTCLGETHRYRIEWNPTTVDFFIDGVLVTSAAFTAAGPMRPAISDFNAGTSLTADWLRMTPYGSPCQTESAIFDGGNPAADWSALNATTLLPGGTTVGLETRTGNTPTPDGTWSAYQAIAGNVIQSPNGRYLQYRATLTSGDPDATPELQAAQVCYNECTPSAEVCDGVDNDCDGTVDDGNPGGGGACSTGNPGVCAAGTLACDNGMLECEQNQAPSAEVCDNLDNDCDGTVDDGNPGGGGACSTGNPGVCAAGTVMCTGGTLQCAQNQQPSAEVCDGADNDCDGQTDEGNPGGGGACNTGNPGVCAAGTLQCQSGSLSCVQTNQPGTEICNNIDDDCDGQTDEGNPGGGGACSTGQQGACGPGTQVCQGGNLVCQPNQSSQPEVCNNVDDDCDSQVDEGNPGGGGSCNTGNPGVCNAGTEACENGMIQCNQNVQPSTEICNTMADENCNGQTDEESCSLCLPANTVSAAGQTKVTRVRMREASNADKLVTRGSFTLSQPGDIAPDGEAVTLRMRDANGDFYIATVPPASFVASPSGRSFRFSDPAAVNNGVRLGRLAISPDGVTVKYTFRSQGLNVPAVVAGDGTATLQIGTNCFTDTQDGCTVSSSGATAICR